ncbi:MAG: FGGY-family carbohydrate kinase [Actinobacteria bacterium]|nr:FGGY-family carbohydrate kinase [Actinomycetota bacterium]
MTDYLVGSDVGTGGTKSVVIDKDGNILGQHFIEYPLLTNSTGYAEHDPEWYWRAVADTISKAVTDSKINPKNIKGVSISALSPACILVDKELKPLQLAHIWMDRRSTKQCEWLKENIGQERIFNLSANPIDPYYALTKLMWERDNRPDLYKRTYKLQTAADYPTMKLTGKAVTDYSNASLIGIAFDIRKKVWDEKLLAEIGIDRQKLPDAYPCEEIIGYVTKNASLSTNIPESTPVVAGTVDATAAWAAGGAIDDGDSSVVMGTAGVLGIVHKKDSFTRNMITIIHTADSKNTYTTVSAQLCGGLYRYFRDQLAIAEVNAARDLGMDPFEIMDIEAEKIKPGCDGLVILPYFQGERTPIWDPYARGLIFGLSFNHTRAHILRAIMEAAGYAFRNNYSIIKKSGIKINLPIILSEGGAKSKLWRQIVCDMLEIPGSYMKSSTGAPLGNAVLAGVGTGVFKDFSVTKKWVKIGDRTEPIAANTKIYEQYYKIFLELYDRNKDLYVELAKIREM